MTRSPWWTAIAVALACACARPVEHAPPLQPESLPPASLDTQPALATPIAVAPSSLSASIQVRFDPAGTKRASQVRVASFFVTVTGAPSGVEGTLNLSTPQGSLYEVLAGTANPTAQLDVPVAGTVIDQNQLTGQWSADFFVAGQPLASSSFQVDP